MKNTVNALFLFIAISHTPVHAEPPTREPHPPRCDEGRVMACQEAHRIAGDHSRQGAYSLDPEISGVRRQLDSLQAPIEDCASETSSEKEERAILSSELSFISESEKSGPAAEILPGFPNIENFFSLSQLQKNWHDRFPSERAQLLTARLTEITEKEARMKPHCDKISSEFRTLNDHFEALRSQRANLLAEADQHVAMCSGGCRRDICPPREP